LTEPVVARAAQRHRTFRDFDHGKVRRGPDQAQAGLRGQSVVERGLVQDVGEGFGVHQPVLDGHVEALLRRLIQHLI